MLERDEYEANDSLRSPSYIYNLLEKLGEKKCALCDCEIPQIVQGAHVWPVANIKNANYMSLDQRIACATDGDNGIWLCNNHHKLFDMNILLLTKQGRLKYISEIEQIHAEFLRESATKSQLLSEILTPNFIRYLEKRNRPLNERLYNFIE